jgi:hypothetical protein
MRMNGIFKEKTEFTDLSIPIRFNGPQPNAFGVAAAVSTACEAGTFVGDTRRGGSCNFEEVTIIPHCNGTHTECVGHITDVRIAVIDCLKDVFVRAQVVTIDPESAAGCKERYAVPFGPGDRLITRSLLEKAGISNHSGEVKALVVRTLPNDSSKMSRSYGDEPFPPYFTNDAMTLIVEAGFEHLLVDLPSIDRMMDDGHLSNHRIFWNIEAGSRVLNSASRINSTVTELIYVPDTLVDGEYLLNLQIAPFVSDAAPSRPLLFPPALT